MDSGLIAYIDLVCRNIANKDTKKLRESISITPVNNQGIVRARFPTPLEFDLYPIPDRFRDVIIQYLKVMKSIYIENDIEQSFNGINEMVNALLRAANTETNWINGAVMNSCSELINIYKVKQKSNPEPEFSEASEDAEFDSTTSTISLIEKLVRTMNKAFTISLNDKNLVLNQSRRIDIYFFLSHLIKLYFRMGKIQLAKSIEKALKGTRSELPPLNWGTTSLQYLITYLYFSALISLDDSDFVAAESKLNEALLLSNHCTNQKAITKQQEKILLILIPLKLFTKKGTLPRDSKLWKRFPSLKYIYRDNIIPALRKGDLKAFELCQSKYQILFLKYHLYLIMEHLKKICYLNLIKKTVTIITSNLGGNHIIPISAFQVALNFSVYRAGAENPHDEKFFGTHLDEVECILANLIYNGKVKGYLSHSNRCIVLSKVNAFP